MTDSTKCPACEIWIIPDDAQKYHDHKVFCDDCLKYLIGYIKYQKKLKEQYDEDQMKKGIAHVE